MGIILSILIGAIGVTALISLHMYVSGGKNY
jgi:hypothetical protein